ncbi:hypothetical protein ACTU45_23120 [Streptomyces sp. 24-1644]|uniref:hypothetical protein n=1 Tax=Streptomyces sp. 24-1644 TaxID=3457315 RepID=UPI003FA6EB72
MTVTTTHFTAWLTTTSAALDQDNIDVTVLEDENIGGDGDEANWACQGGEALYTGVTNVPAEDADHGKAQSEAEDLLSEAGWNTVGTWDDVDTGYIITVERA